jgi:hypothetical protein
MSNSWSTAGGVRRSENAPTRRSHAARSGGASGTQASLCLSQSKVSPTAALCLSIAHMCAQYWEGAMPSRIDGCLQLEPCSTNFVAVLADVCRYCHTELARPLTSKNKKTGKTTRRPRSWCQKCRDKGKEWAQEQRDRGSALAPGGRIGLLTLYDPAPESQVSQVPDSLIPGHLALQHVVSNRQASQTIGSLKSALTAMVTFSLRPNCPVSAELALLDAHNCYERTRLPLACVRRCYVSTLSLGVSDGS